MFKVDDGGLINIDVNAAYNIMKEAFSKVISVNGIVNIGFIILLFLYLEIG